MIDLDNPNVYKQYDNLDMLAHIHNMPDLCNQAWQMATTFRIPKNYSDVNKIIVLGMGGSAIGGELVSSLIDEEARIPILVHRDYNIPAYVNEKTLIVASSYSGMTEETLSAFQQSLKTNSKKLVITTGGRLKKCAQDNGVPVFLFDYKSQPRAALAFSFFPILNFVQSMGFIKDKTSDIDEMLNVIKNLAKVLHETAPLSQNYAKQLAYKLHGNLIVVYGAGLTCKIAQRWKTQINENSKAWAFYEIFPELNHNAVVGYEFPKEISSCLAVIMLKSNNLISPILHRYRITSQILKKANISFHLVEGSGESPLAQMMSLVLFGDYVSYYLAILNKTDPTPVVAIDFLKRNLIKN